jgi:type IV secretory pathway TraG/TraD family ATPase VirD4
MKNPFINQTSHFDDNAYFLKGIERFQLLNNWFNTGLVIGTKRITVQKSLQGALLVAPTGVGKTTSYIIPNLVSLSDCSIIVLDPSGEIYDLTAKYLSKNFTVQTLNLTNPKISEKYCPLFSCKTKDDIAMLADAIIESAFPNSKGSEIFWCQGAMSIINIMINSVKNQPLNYNLAYVYQLLNRLEFDKDFINKHLSETLDDELFNQYKGLLSQPEKVFGSMLGTAKIALSPMGTPSLKQVSSANTINFNNFRKTPTILFVCVPEHRVKFYGFYLSLFFRECFESFMPLPTKKDLVVYMLLDEGGNIYIPQLDTYITVLRKRKVSVSLVLQSLHQLEALYGKNAPIISENLLSHLYYPSLSLETCRDLSQKLGMTEKKPAFTFLPSNEKSNIPKTKIPLMSAEAIRCMQDNRGLYFYGNLPAAKVKFKPWFKSFSMKRKIGRR